MLDEQLLKCLECRLLAKPPKFDMPPPPPPPALLNSLFKDNAFDQKRFLKKCLRMKHFLNGIQQQTNTPNSLPLGNENIIEDSNKQNFWLFNSPETLYMFFFVCTILFLVVLIIAIVFLFKLFKIKKELGQNKNLTNSLTTSDTVSTVSSSNTINSQLLSLKQDNDSQCTNSPQFYNQLFANINSNNQQRVYNQYLQTIPIKTEQNLDEYAEIASQLYEKSIQYTSCEAAYLEKLRLSNANTTVSQASTVSSQGRISGSYLLTNNQNGLLMMNQYKQQQQQQQPLNTYYVC